jgi:hypothetical protein
MFIVSVMVNPRGVIATPTVAVNGGRVPVGLGVRVVASVVAPAIESTAPSEAAATTADLRSVPMGEATTISSAAAAMRRTGERWRSAIRVAVERFNQAPWRRKLSAVFMGYLF